MVGNIIRSRCQKRSGAFGPVPWGWIMIEAKAARDQHEDLSISGTEGKTMEICEAKM